MIPGNLIFYHFPPSSVCCSYANQHVCCSLDMLSMLWLRSYGSIHFILVLIHILFHQRCFLWSYNLKIILTTLSSCQIFWNKVVSANMIMSHSCKLSAQSSDWHTIGTNERNGIILLRHHLDLLMIWGQLPYQWHCVYFLLLYIRRQISLFQ